MPGRLKGRNAEENREEDADGDDCDGSEVKSAKKRAGASGADAPAGNPATQGGRNPENEDRSEDLNADDDEEPDASPGRQTRRCAEVNHSKSRDADGGKAGVPPGRWSCRRDEATVRR